jgi:hypothetical protein
VVLHHRDDDVPYLWEAVRARRAVRERELLGPGVAETTRRDALLDPP